LPLGFNLRTGPPGASADPGSGCRTTNGSRCLSKSGSDQTARGCVSHNFIDKCLRLRIVQLHVLQHAHPVKKGNGVGILASSSCMTTRSTLDILNSAPDNRDIQVDDAINALMTVRMHR
jgi:hypothetical protein